MTHIGGDKAPSDLLCHLDPVRLRDGEQGDIGAGRGEPARCRLTEAAGTSGYQGLGTLHLHCVLLSDVTRGPGYVGERPAAIFQNAVGDLVERIHQP